MREAIFVATSFAPVALIIGIMVYYFGRQIDDLKKRKAEFERRKAEFERTLDEFEKRNN